jgi:hypothetical protein
LKISFLKSSCSLFCSDIKVLKIIPLLKFGQIVILNATSALGIEANYRVVRKAQPER